jgi:hypothetical protein
MVSTADGADTNTSLMKQILHAYKIKFISVLFVYIYAFELLLHTVLSSMMMTCFTPPFSC